MNQERLMKVLVSPHVSEKSTRVADAHGQFVFKVLPDARKPEIKQAVELMFKVEVESVQVMNVKGKRKGFGRVRGKRSDWKKAYVSLKPGHDIDFMGAE
ncbi:MAG: 50S ribosomal protein L23 [Thiotrichales bacterium]|nr:50S ribosomal protein L23 [Thiotrichales bacterium]|tara:strand:- start:50 stop:346 length:297 start_codon:yes stop_codon:yes gene_type:complete